MKDAYTTQELADVLALSRQAILKRAKREGWHSRIRKGQGGGHEWLLTSMPEVTRVAVAAKVCASAALPAEAITSPSAGTAAPDTAPAAERQRAPRGAGAAASLAALTGAAKRRADARIEATLAARTFAAGSGLPYTVALDAFARQYNAGEITLSDATRAELPSLCMSSLRRWDASARTNGAAALAGNYGAHMRGRGCIDSQDIVVNSILGKIGTYPHGGVRVIYEDLQALAHDGLDIKVPSYRSLQMWVKKWKEENPQTYRFITAPDRWRSEHQSATGTAYEQVVRYNQRWEYDGTPADLMLSDGKRHTIVGVINVYSREVKLEVTPTSTGRVVANLTRRCLYDWGVPEEAVTDNGKEFVGAYLQGVFLDLNITPIILPPFRPDLKPAIERVFRSFSHHLLPYCKCYVGHNTAIRKEIEEQKEFARRLMNRTSPEQLYMAISPEELQELCDDWTDKIYRHRPHSGLKGRTPWQVRQEWSGEVRRIKPNEERGLDVLLMDACWCAATKKGVALGKLRYDHQLMAEYEGERVFVRIDPTDKTHAWFFDEDGKFLCCAVEVTGMAAEERTALAIAKKKAQRAHVMAGKRRLEKLGTETDAEGAVDRIRRMYCDKARAIEAMSTAQAEIVPHESDALTTAAQAVRAVEAPASLATGVDVSAALEIARASMAQAEAEHWLPEHPQDKYCLWKSLKARQAAGETLTPDQTEWLQIYTESNEYRGFSMIDPERLRAVNE